MAVLGRIRRGTRYRLARELGLEDLRAELDEARARLDGLHAAIDELERRMHVDGTELRAVDAALADRIGKLEWVVATTEWVRAAPPRDTLISVVMPTRDRAGMLREAVESVRRQEHERWELLVVDDASSDDTPRVLAELAAADERIRPLRNAVSLGQGGARNTALDASRGELIAYLDDDNLMAPLWLKAVAWAFAERPDAGIAYGALLYPMDDQLAPYVQFEPWDHRRLELRNLVDQSAVAHRSGLREARQRGRDACDWDQAARLALERDAVELPVVAVAYRTAAADRLTSASDLENSRRWAAVQQRVLRLRPLRVVGTPGAEPALRDLAAAGARVWSWGAGVDGLEGAPEDLWGGASRMVPDAALLAGEVGGRKLRLLAELDVPLARVGGDPPADVEVDANLDLGELPRHGDPRERHTWLLHALDRRRARLAGFPEPDGEPPALDA